MINSVDPDISLEDLEEAAALSAWFVKAYGDAYRPIFERVFHEFMARKNAKNPDDYLDSLAAMAETMPGKKRTARPTPFYAQG
jgi:hypothetical protein